MPQPEKLKHANAREVVLARIRSGFYRPGQRLPSERELAVDLALSHITIRRGLEDLVDAGVIVKRPRVGNFVPQVRPMELAKRVAIVLPRYMQFSHHPHPVATLVLQGIMGELDQRDCALSIISYYYPQFWLDAGEAMLARGVKGALVWADADTPVDQMEKLAGSGIKVVLLNGDHLWPHLNFSNVSIDLNAPMREAMQRLVDLGHRRLAWISYTETRYRNYEEELIKEFAQTYGLENPDNMLIRLPDQPAFDYSLITELLGRPDRPTGIIVQDEFTAHEVFRACHRMGLNVPRDVSLVAVNDSLPQAHVVPLSAPNTAELWLEAARRAAHHLSHLINSDKDKQIEVVLHAPIQWKESTDKPNPATLSTGQTGSN